MKLLTLTICSLALCGSLYAQQPVLPATGKTPESFIPRGWTLVANTPEDFNKDKLEDAAIVIQAGMEKPTAEKTCHESWYPQVLLIVFQQPDGTYKLNAATQKLFGAGDCMVFYQIGKRSGTLKMAFHDESINGTASEHDYFFRFQQNDWYLIGYKNEMAKNAGPDMGIWGTDKNLVTGVSEDYRLKIDPKSDVMAGPKEITGRKKEKPKPLIRLTQLNVDDTPLAGD